MNKQELIFIYNAKSGFMHAVADLTHKSVSPKTYPCKLCSLTYNGAFMDRLWKQYVASLKISSLFLHRNEFEKLYPNHNIKYPAVMLKTDGSLRTILSAEDFKRLDNLGDLMDKLSENLKNI